MDGVHKLIELLEKRFGKFWADALLLAAVLGAASWGIHNFFAYLVIPGARLLVKIWNYASHNQLRLPSNFNFLSSLISWIITAIFLVAIIVITVRHRLQQKINFDAIEESTSNLETEIAHLLERNRNTRAANAAPYASSAETMTSLNQSQAKLAERVHALQIENAALIADRDATNP